MKQKEITCKKGEVLRLARNWRITLLEGNGWVSTGDGRDIILEKGQSLWLRSSNNLLQAFCEINRFRLEKLDRVRLAG